MTDTHDETTTRRECFARAARAVGLAAMAALTAWSAWRSGRPCPPGTACGDCGQARGCAWAAAAQPTRRDQGQ